MHAFIRAAVFWAILCAGLVPAPVCALTIAAGSYHNLLLRDDGTVWTWGNNASSQLGDGTTVNRATPVEVLSGARAIAGGFNHSLAIRTDGSLWAWGLNSSGQLGDGSTVTRANPVQVMSGVQAIAGGYAHSLALKSDGTLWTWGANGAGQLGDGTTANRTTPAQIMSGVRAIASGLYQSLAIKTDGTLWVWGQNNFGQVGDGTTVARPAPVPVMSGVQAVAGGYYHSLALKTDGTVWAWGYNGNGQVGDGTAVNRPAPLQVLAGVRTLASGLYHSLAIKTDGTLWTWGWNANGQVGDGTGTSRAKPAQVLGAVQAVTGGYAHTLAIRTDGTLWAWGSNANGQLGDGTTVTRTTPVQAMGAVQAIAGGLYHSLAIKTDGSLWAWGWNGYGQLGDGTSVDRGSPVPIMNGVQAVAGGAQHTLAMKTDGTLWTWGWNGSGQLGDGTAVARNAPLQVMSGVRAIAAGYYHSLALKADGTLWAWGYNGNGQLGDGTTVNRPLPFQVMSGVQAIASGYYHSLAIKTDGTLWAWGWNSHGELGDGTFATRAAPVQVLGGVQAAAGGYAHSLALMTDGSLRGWGWNLYGQVGDGTTTDRGTPVPIMNGVRAIAGGSQHSLATKADGTLWMWGAVADPWGSAAVKSQPAQNPLLRNAAGIAAGGFHSLALMADGRALAWGDNSTQQLGSPRPEQSLIPIAVRDPLGAYAGADLVVEYFNPTIRNGAGNPGIGHYFITAVTAEQASIDAGGSGPGWARTGRTFRAWNDPARAPAGAVGVCRFYAREPNSHFYTAGADECQTLRALNPANNPLAGWSYEGIAFYTVVPVGGACPAGYFPVYRSYNNRFGPPATNDGNHRLTPSYNDYQRSLRFFGYADEGIAFCSPASPSPGGDLQATYVYPGASVQSGAVLAAEFLFSNNGAGQADGGSLYVALPSAVSDWTIGCTSRLGATCPEGAALTADALRTGLAIPAWPAGGGLTLTVTGTAPRIGVGGDAALDFAATVTGRSGSPDASVANDTPPLAKTAVQAPAACNAVLNPAALAAGPAAQSPHVSLIIGSGCPWTGQSSVPWLSVTPDSGGGDATIVLNIAANPGLADRHGSLTIAGQTVTVSQAGIPCTFGIAPATLNLAAAAPGTALTLTTPAGCAWSAQSGAPWLVIAPAGGSGSATLTVSAQPNVAPSARTATLSVGDQVVPVAQAGSAEVPPPPPPPADPCGTLQLQRTGDQIAPGGLTGALAFAVVVDTGCAWQAQSAAPWVTLTGGGSGKGNGVVSYLVEPNPDSSTRSGSIRVGGQVFTVNQTGNPVIAGGGDSGGDGGGGDGGGSSGGSSGGAAG